MRTNIIKIFGLLLIVLFLCPSCSKETDNNKTDQGTTIHVDDEAAGYVRDTFDWD